MRQEALISTIKSYYFHLIMKISGHKSLKDFYKYIKIAPEQAGQRIKELWQKRGELKVA